jgi:hypothetical protein
MPTRYRLKNCEIVMPAFDRKHVWESTNDPIIVFLLVAILPNSAFQRTGWIRGFADA